MNIGIVLVTFNRLDKLKVALERYEKQTHPFQYLLIVDNHSTDGTKEFLEQWQKQPASYQKYCIFLNQNTGGAGGFHAGMEKALTLNADWIWISDDDAYPRETAFEKLADFYEKQTPEFQKNTAALCSAVYNNHQIHKEHRNHLKVTKFKCMICSSSLEEYKQEAFQLEIFSYVGALIKISALKKTGLDEKNFFIYCDDQEHSLRLSRNGNIYCVPASIVDHDTPPFDKNAINWGRYYKKRNDLLMIKKNFPYRYFLLRYLRRYLTDASVFSKNPEVLRKELKAAYHDAWNDKMGLHEIYKPGWQPPSDKS